MTIPLCVSPEEKELAKSHGAIWHREGKCWFLPSGVNPTPLLKWIPLYYLKKIAPDLTPDVILTVEAIPRTCMFSNVRTLVEKEDWDKIRKWVYRQAGYRCQICGSVGDEWPVEAHERWFYDRKTLTQKLDGLVALCPQCHQVKHIGLAQQRGKLNEAIEHMMEVNEWPYRRAESYLEDFADVYEELSCHEWKLDVSWLSKLGYNIVVDERENERSRAAKMKVIEEILMAHGGNLKDFLAYGGDIDDYLGELTYASGSGFLDGDNPDSFFYWGNPYDH